MADAQQQSNISINPNQAYIGLNLDTILREIKPGMLSYALNAQVENWDGNSITYQNEQGNEICVTFPTGYKVIGIRNIIELGIIIVMLANPTTGGSEIGKVVGCTYTTLINADCLGFDINHPILKIVYKLTNCSTEVYWTDAYKERRYIKLEDLPFKTIEGCPPVVTTEVDCNLMAVQPNFAIPELVTSQVNNGGDLTAGTYQFAIQYANAKGEEYTAFYSVTNPLPVFDSTKITQDFNYNVGRSIQVDVSNLDISGYFEYFNLAVIKTVNNISTPELVGTYQITGASKAITYTGENKTAIKLSIDDIFQKSPVYDVAKDVTSVQDVLVWGNVTTAERISYQKIANKITLNWQTWKTNGDSPYKDELNSVFLRGYMRDEVYPFEFVVLLTKGRQTDGFHIPGRTAISTDLTVVSNDDVVDVDVSKCGGIPEPQPKWKVYNTGCKYGYEQAYLDFVNDIQYTCPKCPPVTNINPDKVECYTGPFEYGCFSYWESTETYPCDEDIWGELANKPIRHHKFPDSTITHIHDNNNNIYPIGVKIDVWQIQDLINNSPDLTAEQKKEIVGFKIVRGNRANHKSVVAKGLINNVGIYERDSTTYYFPNYPYNDLREDPFITGGNNYDPTDGTSGGQCITYTAINTSTTDQILVNYIGCPPNSTQQSILLDPNTTSLEFCAMQYPTITDTAGAASNNGVINSGDPCGSEGTSGGSTSPKDPLNAFSNIGSERRFIFHSPDTHFYQPYLGDVLKLETAEFGKTDSHFVQVKNHSRYKFLTNGAVATALGVGLGVGFASGSYGVGSTNVFNGTAAYTAFQVFLDILNKTAPKKNFAYQFNSVGRYTDFVQVPNNGSKQRYLDLASYAAPGMINVGDTHTLNNWQRESSVYLRSTKALPFVSSLPTVPEDNSRFTLSEVGNCDIPTNILHRDISSYYGSIKKQLVNQYGQIYTYETIDTGYQFIGDFSSPIAERYASVFGGDIYINKFAYKTKLPFFVDNRVGDPDESDVFYNEIGNIAYPKYWFSTDIRKGSVFGLFGVKNTNFDCKQNSFFYDAGKIYLFAYGIPHYFCESEVNVDYRQAYNASEGDFYPRVGSGIPDDWLQEINTTIQQDNTYWYNKTYSKQNKENYFSHLPDNFTSDECKRTFEARAIYSEQQVDWVDSTSNKWLLYRPISFYDFPYPIVSLDGIENKAILARFDNKSQMYNALLTVSTSNPKAAYLGNSSLFAGAPPIDFAETDLGFAGSQHKFLLKTEYGHLSIDAKRGQVFLFTGTQAKEISIQGVGKFLTEYLSFEIKKAFPAVSIDNNFNGCGLHGVYDSKYNRAIITKIDYKPKVAGIIYSDNKFSYRGVDIELTDDTYFCNNSFTLSYDFDNQTWISFHSYLPNYYIGDANYFYSGMNSEAALWRHGTSLTTYNSFYGKTEPYVIEYPYSYQYNDEILQNVKDYTKVLQYTDWQSFIELDDVWFNKAILYNNQQCSGVLLLTKKPQNNLAAYNTYPKYNVDSKEILFTKRDNFYQFNTFWGLNVDKKKSIWNKSCESLSVFKELNQDNMSYSKRSFHKDTLRAKDLKCRFILDNRNDVKMISQFTTAPTQKSYL